MSSRATRQRELLLGILVVAALLDTRCALWLLSPPRIDVLIVVGELLDSESSLGVTADLVRVRTFTENVLTDDTRAIVFGEDPTPGVPRPDSPGEFAAPFVSDISGPGEPPPKFPDPDQIEVRVVRQGCEQSFMIDINADTVVDLTFPDDVIELKDPILVPPCEP